METKEEPIVLYTDDNAAEKITLTGWISRNRKFYNQDEHMARWDGCTHMICDCGNSMKKSYTKCEECIMKKNKKIRDELPIEEWDGVVMIFDDASEKYFSDMEEIGEYLADNDLDTEDLDLYLCTPNYVSEINSENWADDLPEDQEDLPKELQQKLDEFNKFISESKIILSWSPSKVRTNYIPENN